MTDLELGGAAGGQFATGTDSPDTDTAGGFTRRRMIGYLIAAPTLVAAVQWAEPAAGARPDGPAVGHLRPQRPAQPGRGVDGRTWYRCAVNSDGTASFDAAARRGRPGHHDGDRDDHRRRDGHSDRPGARSRWPTPARSSSATSSPAARTRCTRSSARAHRGATARGRLLQAAAEQLGVSDCDLDVARRRHHGARRALATFGSLAKKAAVTRSTIVKPKLKRALRCSSSAPTSGAIDAPTSSRGKKVFAMDLEVRDALPTMVCRPPTINGKARRQRATPPRSRRCRASPTSRSSRTPVRRRRRGRARQDVRAVHRRGPRAGRRLGQGHGRRQVRRVGAGRPQEGRAPAHAGAPGQDRGGGLHVPLPARRSARDQLRHRRRAARTAPRSGRAEVADHVPRSRSRRRSSRCRSAKVKVHVTRGRRVVRPAPLRRRGATRRPRSRRCSASR